MNLMRGILTLELVVGEVVESVVGSLPQSGGRRNVRPIERPFVFILWTDACTRHGWASAEDATEGVELVWSSGHMLERNAREVKLASDVGLDNFDINRRIAIPVNMILEIREGSMTGPILFERRKRGPRNRKPEAAS